ncbi:MAG: hypothetical protein LC808_33760 [Actinobacteria bacterium]|nr:hypothetical protein [Actinomycetota bacterium]
MVVRVLRSGWEKGATKGQGKFLEELVSGLCNGDSLSQQHVTTVVVRLVTRRGGELSHGALVDTTGRVLGRFQNWEDLVRALRAWIAQEDSK